MTKGLSYFLEIFEMQTHHSQTNVQDEYNLQCIVASIIYMSQSTNQCMHLYFCWNKDIIYFVVVPHGLAMCQVQIVLVSSYVRKCDISLKTVFFVCVRK